MSIKKSEKGIKKTNKTSYIQNKEYDIESTSQNGINKNIIRSKRQIHVRLAHTNSSNHTFDAHVEMS